MSVNRNHPGLNLGTSDGAIPDASEIRIFGFWVFLMSDLILFGLLFATYAVMSQGGQIGLGPQSLFDLRSIVAQTGLLLASSFTYGMASLVMKYEQGRAQVLIWVAVTGLLGAGFVLLEARDFMDMIGKGAVPQASSWLSAWWALVGLHGLHLVAGLIWIAVTMAQIAVQGLSDAVKSRVLLLGLYWHFLDLVWIAIFTVVFLGGMT